MELNLFLILDILHSSRRSIFNLKGQACFDKVKNFFSNQIVCLGTQHQKYQFTNRISLRTHPAIISIYTIIGIKRLLFSTIYKTC